MIRLERLRNRAEEEKKRIRRNRQAEEPKGWKKLKKRLAMAVDLTKKANKRSITYHETRRRSSIFKIMDHTYAVRRKSMSKTISGPDAFASNQPMETPERNYARQNTLRK